jgi:putative DNA methylase
MIPKECKRLAEVDFPIAVVSKHSAREKSIRHGHPSTLHLWWARRPLAACRAMLMALLLPDPCDPNCPEEFKTRARNILPRVQGKPGSKDLDIRNELLRFIGDFSNWDNSTNTTYLGAARGLVRAAHGQAKPDGAWEYDPPLVVDPFAGGGSIPLEALRLGCDAFASDLNPVACLILKTMLEDIPRHGPGLADELRKVGAEIKTAAEKELSEFYPTDPDGSKPIAYLWARTITCDSCGAEIPLMRSFWLCKKANRRKALRLVQERDGRGDGDALNKLTAKKGSWRYEIFEPKSEDDVRGGTVTRGNAVCPCCNTVQPVARVRTQLAERRGGADAISDGRGVRIGGARLLAVVTLDQNKSGRQYRLPIQCDYEAVWKAQKRLKRILDGWERGGRTGLCPLPDEPLPPTGTLGFRIQRYGMLRWGDLFTARQKLALLALPTTVRNAAERHALGDGILEPISLALSRCSDFNSSLTTWAGDFVRGTFGRAALPVVWDFCESFPLTETSGGLDGALDWVSSVAEAVGLAGLRAGQAHIRDARSSSLPDESAGIWFTDPPYYDAVPYADLSDFFFVWLKRCLPGHPLLRDPYDPANTLTPKRCEVVQDETKRDNGSVKDRAWFERTMAKAFAEGRRVLSEDGIGSVVFAHKTTEGWEALLSGMVSGGWVIRGSWPIATERPGRLRSQDSAALATSVHLVCRTRPEDAPTGDWGDVLRELPQRVGDWIERLQAEGIKGADLVFACIGPAMEIYSRYRRVEDAEGREIPLGGDPTAAEPYKRGFLAYVWETVGRLALEEVLGTAEAKARNGAAGALEEDSRLTALFLWTVQTTNTEDRSQKSAASSEEDEEGEVEDGDEDQDTAKAKKKKTGYTLIYDVARRFAQPLGIHLDKWEGRIIETEKGIVRLLPVTERAEQLFGEADASAISRRIEQDAKASRNLSFAFMQESGTTPEVKSRSKRRDAKHQAGDGTDAPSAQRATTLDRLHAAMLLQRSGQTNGLRALLKDEIQRGPDFLRLANALSRLYPKDSDEKRLLDAMLLAVPR